MFIHRFRVKNFMVHQDTTIDLCPLSVFVGPNGGGKSALFHALINFSMVSRGQLSQAFGQYPYSYYATLFRGTATKQIARIGFEVEFSASANAERHFVYEIDYAQQKLAEDQSKPRFTIFKEKLKQTSPDKMLFDRSDPDDYDLANVIEVDDDRGIFSGIRLAGTEAKSAIDSDLLHLAQQISRFNNFRLDPFVLANPSRIPDLTDGADPSYGPRVGFHGEDLAGTLFYLSETRNPSLEVIRDAVRELVPEFDDFEFSTVGPDRIAFSVRHSDSRGTVNSARLSSGMLTYIGLIVLTSMPNRPAVMMIEEPENGLTPQAIKLFYQAVRRLACNEHETERSQVILSSHSPFVICEAWNGEDRDFIHQVKVTAGKASVRKFKTVLDENGVQLQKDATGQRNVISLKTAEEVMSGRFSN